MKTHLPPPSLTVFEDFLGAGEIQHLPNVFRADAIIGILHTVSNVFSDGGEKLLDEKLVAFCRDLPLGKVNLTKIIKHKDGYMII